MRDSGVGREPTDDLSAAAPKPEGKAETSLSPSTKSVEQAIGPLSHATPPADMLRH